VSSVQPESDYPCSIIWLKNDRFLSFLDPPFWRFLDPPFFIFWPPQKNVFSWNAKFFSASDTNFSGFCRFFTFWGVQKTRISAILAYFCPFLTKNRPRLGTYTWKNPYFLHGADSKKVKCRRKWQISLLLCNHFFAGQNVSVSTNM